MEDINYKVGDKVKIKEGCGCTLWDHGCMSFERKPLSGILQPADSTNHNWHENWSVYIRIAPMVMAITHVDCIELSSTPDDHQG